MGRRLLSEENLSRIFQLSYTCAKGPDKLNWNQVWLIILFPKQVKTVNINYLLFGTSGLNLSYCDHWISVLRHVLCVNNNCFKGHLLNYWLELDQTLQDRSLLLTSLILLQMVLVHCLSRSDRLKVDFQCENFENLIVWNNNAESLDIWYVVSSIGFLPSLLKVCHKAKIEPTLGVACLT